MPDPRKAKPKPDAAAPPPEARGDSTAARMQRPGFGARWEADVKRAAAAPAAASERPARTTASAPRSAQDVLGSAPILDEAEGAEAFLSALRDWKALFARVYAEERAAPPSSALAVTRSDGPGFGAPALPGAVATLDEVGDILAHLREPQRFAVHGGKPGADAAVVWVSKDQPPVLHWRFAAKGAPSARGDFRPSGGWHLDGFAFAVALRKRKADPEPRTLYLSNGAGVEPLTLEAPDGATAERWAAGLEAVSDALKQERRSALVPV